MSDDKATSEEVARAVLAEARRVAAVAEVLLDLSEACDSMRTAAKRLEGVGGLVGVRDSIVRANAAMWLTRSMVVDEIEEREKSKE